MFRAAREIIKKFFAGFPGSPPPGTFPRPETAGSGDKPPEPARGKTDSGKALCLYCLACVNACPRDCLRLVKSETAGDEPVWKNDFGDCDLCGDCAEVCPTGFRTFGNTLATVSNPRQSQPLVRESVFADDYPGPLDFKPGGKKRG